MIKEEKKRKRYHGLKTHCLEPFKLSWFPFPFQWWDTLRWRWTCGNMSMWCWWGEYTWSWSKNGCGSLRYSPFIEKGQRMCVKRITCNHGSYWKVKRYLNPAYKNEPLKETRNLVVRAIATAWQVWVLRFFFFPFFHMIIKSLHSGWQNTNQV